MVRTVERNQIFLLRELKKRKPFPYEGYFFFRHHPVFNFVPKQAAKNLLLSTIHNGADVSLDSEKPELGLTYNKIKEGVDEMDHIAHACSQKGGHW